MPELEEQLLAAAGVTEEEEVATEVSAEVSIEETATEETPAETTETPETPVETPAEETKSDLFAYIRNQYGEDFSGKYQSNEELLKGLVHAAKKIGERNEEAQMGRWLRERPQEAFAWLQAQIPQQQKEAQTNGVPEYNPEWARQVEVDENGRAINVKPGYHPDTVHKFNRALEYYHQQQRELVFNPKKALEPLLAEARQQAVQEARQQWEQEWNARYGQMTEQQEAQQIYEGHRRWLYNEGNPQKGFTAAGRVYNEAVQQWIQRRPELSSREVDELGRMAVQARFPQQTKPAGKKPGAAKSNNVQQRTQTQELKRLPNESAIEFFTRIDQQYNMIPDD